ncbi:MAG: PAS domain S-box protein [Deltaproteobacteria bacterium]|nr:PAS domain S-box protein [Deltaproteobacteria bacterium]
MRSVSITSAQEKSPAPVHVIRGKQADVPLNAAIVGGGKACYNLLLILDKERLSRLRMKIMGIADPNEDAPGLKLARELNLFTSSRLQDLFELQGLNVIIELTGSDAVRDHILQSKPSGVSLIDSTAARLLWDLIQMEEEKIALEREKKRYETKTKRDTQLILDSLPYRTMVVNLNRTVETVNQTFLREFDVTREEVMGQPCWAVRYGLDKPCNEKGGDCVLLSQLDELKEKGLISRYREYKDELGETHFDVITVAPIYDEQGELVQILQASRDVTDRIKLEREAQKSNIFFQNVIRSTVDGIVVVDTKGNVLIFNEGMEQLTGYSSEEIINLGHLSTFYDIDVAKENMRKMRSDQYGPQGKLNPTSMTIKTKSGEEIPITLSASIITIDGKETGSVGVFRDMREILAMQKKLEEAHLQLVQSEKIASVGRMAAGVAHEVNNPLSGIMLYAELLKESFTSDSQQVKDVQEIIDQTLRCKRIVSELLEFSRQSVGKVSSFTVEELINKSLNLLINQALFQDIAVIRDIQPDIPAMVGDIGQLQQVFTNLFINAADAMQGKGRLEISARFDADKEMFTMTVSDTGPGIPQHLRDKIFDIFFTTKQVGKGTGLGLAISQNIIKLHGGSIAVNCPQEGGTMFTIELPIGFVEQPVDEPVFIG